jgi:hypothetical protein
MRSGLILLLLSTPAFAQEPPPVYVEPTTPAGPQSILPNLLSTAQGGTIDARADYTHDGTESDLTLVAITAHGQYISPGGLGGYIVLPMAYASAEDESETGLGNIEVGGLYAIRSGATDILLRGGISLNTAGDEQQLLVPVSQLSPRLNDAYPTGFDTTWGRAQAQLRHASGTLRLGAAAGFDVPVGGALADSEGFDGLLNVAVGVGIEQPGFGVGVGIAYLQALTDGDSDDDSISSFNATVDFPIGPTARLFGTFGIPDLDNAGDNGTDLFAIGAGVRVGLQ